MVIDIYDFDKTVYPTDSLSAFWLFCMVRKPWIILYLPFQLFLFLLWGLGIMKTGKFKSCFLFFVRFINTEKCVKKFWDKNQRKIYPWFLPENRERYTVVISASPDFLLGEICSRLKVDKLICTAADSKSGKIIGKNCKGEEKTVRLKEEMGAVSVKCVYSDSIKSDAPIFRLGEKKINTINGKLIAVDDVFDNIKN